MLSKTGSAPGSQQFTVLNVMISLWFSSHCLVLSFLKNHNVQAFCFKINVLLPSLSLHLIFLRYLKGMFDHQLRAHILMLKIPLVLTKSFDLDTGNALLEKLEQIEH